jgi:hypothetical protein
MIPDSIACHASEVQMPAGVLFRVLLVCCLLPTSALAADPWVYNPYLLNGLVHEDTSNPDRCSDVGACARLAADDPEHFSESLEHSLSDLPAADLVEGLSWKHERPAVTQRVLDLVENALVNKLGHTDTSALRLLKHALQQTEREQQVLWFFVLAHDVEGRVALGDFIDAHPKDELARLGMMQYVRSAPRKEGGSFRGEQRDNLVLSQKDRTRQKAYVEVLWRLYVARRIRQATETSTAYRLALDLPFDEQLFQHVQGSEAYASRLAALVEGDIRFNRAPLWRELTSCMSRTKFDPDAKKRLVAWLSSENRVLSFLATQYVLTNGAGLTRTERDQVLLSAGFTHPIPAERPNEEPQLFRRMLPNISAKEAVALAAVAETAPSHEERLRLLTEIGEQYPEYRQQIVRAYASGSTEDLVQMASVLPIENFPELRRGMVSWLLSLREDAMLSIEGEDHVRVLISWLDNRFAGEIYRPGLWRHEVFYVGGCGTGRAHAAEMQRSRDDLAAFGLPLPAHLQVRKWKEAEPSVQERAVREQQLAMVLLAAQEHFRAQAKP